MENDLTMMRGGGGYKMEGEGLKEEEAGREWRG